MKKLVLFISLLIFSSLTKATQISIQGATKHEETILKQSLNEIIELLPITISSKLPSRLKIVLTNLNVDLKSNTFPIPTCSMISETEISKKNTRITYGTYTSLSKTLRLDKRIIFDLENGLTRKFNCYHGNMKAQARTSILHELVHAYDIINPLKKRISDDEEFLRLADFKPGFLGLPAELKNINPQTSPNFYEITNPREYFAIQMEYFLTDPNYLCARPTMANYLIKKLKHQPFNTNCKGYNKILVSNNGIELAFELNNDRVYRVDYLLASKGSTTMSGYGHSMFRLIICAPTTEFGPKCLLDTQEHLVVSYRANVSDLTVDYLKGFLGGYTSKLFVIPLETIKNEYNTNELRDLYSIPLKLSESQKIQFIQRVIEHSWNYNGNYKFISNNCASESEDLLKSSLISSQGNMKYTESSISPYGFLESIFKSGLAEKVELENLVSVSRNSLQDKTNFYENQPLTAEVFKPNTEKLINAIKLLYKIKHTQEMNSHRIYKIITSSTPKARNSLLEAALDRSLLTANIESPTRTEMELLFKNYEILTGAMTLESQFILSKSQELNKQLMTELENPSHKEFKSKLEQFKRELNAQNTNHFTTDKVYSYGIPSNEILSTSKDSLTKSINLNKKLIEFMEELKLRFMKVHHDEYELISQSKYFYHLTYGFLSSIQHKILLMHLERYLHEEIKKLSAEVDSRELLIRSLTRDESLHKIRNLLGNDIVSSKYVTNEGLRLKISKQLNSTQ